MIISKTPVRMSFAGGGSDLKAYYDNMPGAVLSTTIDKYIYITVNRRFSDMLRVAYSQVEEVEKVEDIQHRLVRESMKLSGLKKGIDISYVSDLLPAHEGSGLGSSSSLTVGTLNALYAHKGLTASAELLASQASDIEINKLGAPIGKQDQYAVAYGGLNFIEFYGDETVSVKKVIIPKKIREKLEDNLLAFHTGIYTRSDLVLTEQRKTTKDKLGTLEKMVNLAHELKDSLERKDLSEFGNILHKNWVLKKEMSDKMTNPEIENYYKKAMNAGALGGKILGSGGGGFLLFYCEEENHEKLKEALKDLRQLPFKFETSGSRIIYVGNDTYEKGYDKYNYINGVKK